MHQQNAGADKNAKAKAPRIRPDIRRHGRGLTETMLPDQKLNALVARHGTLERELTAVVPPETFVKLSREFAELTPVVEAVKSYRAAERELEGVTQPDDRSGHRS